MVSLCQNILDFATLNNTCEAQEDEPSFVIADLNGLLVVSKTQKKRVFNQIQDCYGHVNCNNLVETAGDICGYLNHEPACKIRQIRINNSKHNTRVWIHPSKTGLNNITAFQLQNIPEKNQTNDHIKVRAGPLIVAVCHDTCAISAAIFNICSDKTSVTAFPVTVGEKAEFMHPSMAWASFGQQGSHTILTNRLREVAVWDFYASRSAYTFKHPKSRVCIRHVHNHHNLHQFALLMNTGSVLLYDRRQPSSMVQELIMPTDSYSPINACGFINKEGSIVACGNTEGVVFPADNTRSPIFLSNYTGTNFSRVVVSGSNFYIRKSPGFLMKFPFY